MLRIISKGNQLPFMWPVDGDSVFEPGMIGQLKVVGNEIVCGVSDGTSPLGIIDDIRTTVFSKPIIDEVQIIPATGILNPSGQYVSTTDVSKSLDEPNIIKSSFRINEGPSGALNEKNGIITIPKGTVLNYDSDEDGTNDSFKIVVSYYYHIAGLPGDDTTVGSGRITIWFGRGIFETDQFDMGAQYYLNAQLYVGLDGKFTTTQPTANHPAVAMVTGPPTALVGSLEFLWF